MLIIIAGIEPSHLPLRLFKKQTFRFTYQKYLHREGRYISELSPCGWDYNACSSRRARAAALINQDLH